MILSVQDFQKPFFIGIAGSGMSALAQYLQGSGKTVSGSDRFFAAGSYNEVQEKLEAEGIRCFAQDGSGLQPDTDLVVISSAVEETVPELQMARQRSIPILKRSELLALIAASKKTVAVAGTSGKSTTSAMLYEILEHADLQPGIISGAGLVSLIRKGKIGNAQVGTGEWLVIEADESDGSLVQYKPEAGLLLNIDKDHKELDELLEIFEVFRRNCQTLSVNLSHPLASRFSKNRQYDFSLEPGSHAGYIAGNFSQEGWNISFTINAVPFFLNITGKHNMENALAAAAMAHIIGVPLQTSAAALKNYGGIYRRQQVIGNKNGVWLVDDYAHNPVKCAAAIRACQPVAPKLVAWFQPHGYGPTRFLRAEFVKELAAALRPGDEIWMSEIFYAGGTAVKNISSADLVADLRAQGCAAYFIANREELVAAVRPHLTGHCVLLLMGARDPSLEGFAWQVWELL